MSAKSELVGRKGMTDAFEEYSYYLAEGIEPQVAATLCLAAAVRSVAYQIRNLGNADASTPLGAIEGLGAVMKEGFEALALAMEQRNERQE